VNILDIKTDTAIVLYGYSLVLSLRTEHTFREYQYKLLMRIFETTKEIAGEWRHLQALSRYLVPTFPLP
jgi:hypothetical protein